jgi:hypothetical protein
LALVFWGTARVGRARVRELAAGHGPDGRQPQPAAAVSGRVPSRRAALPRPAPWFLRVTPRYIRVRFAVPRRRGQCWSWIGAEERNGMESGWLAGCCLAGWLAGSSGGDVPGWLLGARTTWMAPSCHCPVGIHLGYCVAHLVRQAADRLQL